MTKVKKKKRKRNPPFKKDRSVHHISVFSLFQSSFSPFTKGEPSSLAEYKGGRAREYRNMTANWRGVIRLLKGLGGGENQIRLISL